ncbi:MAG: (deoxy)nucleoside triphosphate pyrophosphohydrolase [Candidatus Nanopelagicales bacterium]
MAPPQDAQLVVAAAIVDSLDAPTRLLTARRRAPSKYVGQWEFPGGKVEPGEAPIAALHRELDEELGVTVSIGPEIHNPQAETWPAANGIEIRLWLAEVASGEPVAGVAHDDLKWLPPTQWDSVRWLAPDLPMLEELRDVVAR